MYDVAIIGAGPAGSSAGIFLAKAGKKTVIIDSDAGMTKRAWVENHYGVPQIAGPDLVETGKKQAQKFGAEIVASKATDLVKADDGFRVETENGSFESKYVILATGASVELAEKAGVKTKDGTEPRIKTVCDVDPDGRTNIDGIWAAGTTAGVSVHTIITSGDGAKVAINIISEMNGSRYVDHDVLKKD